MSRVRISRPLALLSLLLILIALLIVAARLNPTSASAARLLPQGLAMPQASAALPSANSSQQAALMVASVGGSAMPAALPTPAVSSDNCVACHTNRALLQQMAPGTRATPKRTGPQAHMAAATAPPEERWQQVLITDTFLSNVHNTPGCIACHGGTSGTINFAEAHKGLLPKASAQPSKACASCHVGVVADARTSLHRMQWGFQTALEARGADFTHPEMVQAYGEQCTACHADCGDCHVSRPAVVGGGLTAGHAFTVTRQVSVTSPCGDCHNATVNADYTGAHEGIEPDVHWQRMKLSCMSCHAIDQVHGGSQVGRYDEAPEPSCTQAGCHEQETIVGAGNLQHTIHTRTVQCQVCHAAGEYSSCQGCHTDQDARGKPTHKLDKQGLTFKIGRNPLQSKDRPWTYVLLRPSPAATGLFDAYGEDLLPEFESAPTWALATPHNMQRVTPQNSGCNNCHGQEDLFLTNQDLTPDELEANRSVIVTRVPAARREAP